MFIQFDKTLDRQKQYLRRNYLLAHEVDKQNNKDTDQAIINIGKNDLGEELPSMILIGHIAQENVSFIIMFYDPLLLSLQGATFVIEFLKLKKNLKKKMRALQNV